MTPPQKHHHTTTTKTPPHHHHKNTTTPPQKKATTPTQKHHRTTIPKTQPHHHTITKNTTISPQQKHHHKSTTTTTKAPPYHHHKNTTTPPQKHSHTTTTKKHHKSTTRKKAEALHGPRSVSAIMSGLKGRLSCMWNDVWNDVKTTSSCEEQTLLGDNAATCGSATTGTNMLHIQATSKHAQHSAVCWAAHGTPGPHAGLFFLHFQICWAASWNVQSHQHWEVPNYVWS